MTRRGNEWLEDTQITYDKKWYQYVTLLIKVHIVKTMVFPVVMYGCESWTMKKSEC